MPPRQRSHLALCRLVGLLEGIAIIKAPNAFTKQVVEEPAREPVRSALRTRLEQEVQLSVSIDDSLQDQPLPDFAAGDRDARDSRDPDDPDRLDDLAELERLEGYGFATGDGRPRPDFRDAGTPSIDGRRGDAYPVADLDGHRSLDGDLARPGRSTASGSPPPR